MHVSSWRHPWYLNLWTIPKFRRILHYLIWWSISLTLLIIALSWITFIGWILDLNLCASFFIDMYSYEAVPFSQMSNAVKEIKNQLFSRCCPLNTIEQLETVQRIIKGCPILNMYLLKPLWQIFFFFPVSLHLSWRWWTMLPSCFLTSITPSLPVMTLESVRSSWKGKTILIRLSLGSLAQKRGLKLCLPSESFWDVCVSIGVPSTALLFSDWMRKVATRVLWRQIQSSLIPLILFLIWILVSPQHWISKWSDQFKFVLFVCPVASHRRRSNTAQRLEKLKREKHKQSKIKHIQWKSVEYQPGMGVSVYFILISYCKQVNCCSFVQSFLTDTAGVHFEKMPVEKDKTSRKSKLTQLLENSDSSSCNAFMEYAKFDGKVTIFTSQSLLRVSVCMG